jgi:hypothetical protein
MLDVKEVPFLTPVKWFSKYWITELKANWAFYAYLLHCTSGNASPLSLHLLSNNLNEKGKL